MMEIGVTAAAQHDLTRLRAFLTGKSERAAIATTDALFAAIESLEKFPERGRPGRGAGRRELVVNHGRDGYVIRYRVTSKGCS